MFLYVHRDHKDYYGGEALYVHLDFHTAPELWRRKEKKKKEKKKGGGGGRISGYL